uniref:Uncharacterized protein n=1 Tax=Fagus sylvatica TaxID=28930 RepID=A0A2N9G8Q5_FAGSY
MGLSIYGYGVGGAGIVMSMVVVVVGFSSRYGGWAYGYGGGGGWIFSDYNGDSVGGRIFTKIQDLVVVEESGGGGGGSGVCGDVFVSFLEFICGGGLGFGFYEVDRDGGCDDVRSGVCGGVFAGFLEFVCGGVTVEEMVFVVVVFDYWGFLGLGFGFYKLGKDGCDGGRGSGVCGGVFAGFLLEFSGFGFGETNREIR